MEDENDQVEVVVTNVDGDFCIKKTRRKRQKALVQQMFYDYANNTTLQGLPYTTKRGLTLIEKIFWLITFIASVCLCFYLIQNVFIKWKISPVIVGVSEKLVSVREVPFPSVTICPQSKSKATYYNYSDEKMQLEDFWIKYNSESEFLQYKENFTMFADVSNICGMYCTYSESFIFFSRNYSDATLVNNIIDVALKKNDIFEVCKWRGKEDINCTNTLHETLTSEGLCYTFNSLAAHEILREDIIQHNFSYIAANKPARNWTMKHGYSDYGPNVYPARGKAIGPSPDLEIIMRDYLYDRDLMCNRENSGFKVYIQHPEDLPQSSLYYYVVLNKQVTSMALSFNVLNTSENLKDYDPEIRQCFFPNERYLKYFKLYTAKNCLMECVANFTFDYCGCVGFYMPHETSERICTVQRLDCMKEAQELVLLQETSVNNKNKKCRCLPACNAVDYGAELLKTAFNYKKVIKTMNNRNRSIYNVSGYQFSKLEMYFKQPRFLSMRRSELFGVTDFFANIGGLLGLFLGFSFLSLVELVYFVTLRLWCELRKDLKEEKIQRQNTIIKKK